jgi:hypothetical protein
MNEEYYKELVNLLNEKINRLELEKDRQRKEINRLKAELRKTIKTTGSETQNDAI